MNFVFLSFDICLDQSLTEEYIHGDEKKTKMTFYFSVFSLCIVNIYSSYSVFFCYIDVIPLVCGFCIEKETEVLNIDS
jgi:hypothetical protein